MIEQKIMLKIEKALLTPPTPSYVYLYSTIHYYKKFASFRKAFKTHTVMIGEEKRHTDTLMIG